MIGKTNITLEYKKIGTNRTEIMGFSIIMIMLFHCGLLSIGDIGVDFFLFISGYSMYHSLSKNDNTQTFLIKRADRILPMYLIVAIPYYIYNSSTIGDFFLRITNVAVFTEGYLNGWWFIGAICFCYAFSPILYKEIKRHNRYKYIAIILISFVCYLIGYFFENSSIVMFRIPDFLVGFLVADNINDDKIKSNDKLLLVLTVVFMGIFFVALFTNKISLIWKYKNAVYSILTFPIVSLLGMVLQRIKGIVKKILSFFGTITLELYLLHEYFSKPLAKNILNSYSGGVIFTFLDVLLSIIIALLMAYILHMIIGHFLSSPIKTMIKRWK